MDRGLHHQRTFTWDGQDQLEVLIMEAIIQVTEVSASNKKQEVPARKTESSGMPNQTIRFPQREQRLLVSSASTGYGSRDLLLRLLGVVKTSEG
jgi:hypothetical protein